MSSVRFRNHDSSSTNLEWLPRVRRGERKQGVVMMRRIFLLVLALVPMCAQAGFKVVETPPPPKAPAPIRTASLEPAKSGYKPLDGGEDGGFMPSSANFGLSAVSYIGKPPAEIEVRRGIGHDVRLADALKQIAPPGWRGFGRAEVAGSFDPNKSVSWNGGKPWTAVLDALARTEGMSIEVDWDRQHIYVGKREVRQAATSTPGSTAPTNPVAAVAAPAWEAKVGTTVRATMEDWSKRGGWQLIWPMGDLDYRIIAPLRFEGSLVDATSKLTRLYESADRPLAVDIHTTQKVIVFSEKGIASP